MEEWTPERMEDRLTDHPKRKAAAECFRASKAAEASTAAEAECFRHAATWVPGPATEEEECWEGRRAAP